ncbi:hypothetical protein OF855_00995 [Mycolicibacterium fortuitum]|nr:hypothetical protein [Mycolicibacterium fortuitum]WAY19745.1 hypothetical protein OF855_00995 [Mycolicibacterium fortuitum]
MVSLQSGMPFTGAASQSSVRGLVARPRLLKSRGLLVDRGGFPLEIGCFEGNKAKMTQLGTEVGYGRDSAHTAMYARAIVGATERVAQALAAPPTDRAQTDAMADGVLDLVWHGLSPVPTT